MKREDSFSTKSTCESHSGALKAHNRAVDQLAPILRSAGHTVKCQYKVAPSEGKKRGHLETVGYLRDATGPSNLVNPPSVQTPFPKYGWG